MTDRSTGRNGFDVRAQLFCDRSVLAHVGTLALGAVVAVGTYVLVVSTLGGHAAIGTDAAHATRRLGIAASGTVLGAYLASAFVRGLGGPLLNLVFLMAHVVLTPVAAIRLTGGALPETLLVSAPLYTPTFVAQTVTAVVLPLATYTAGHTLWFRYRYSPAERAEWTEKHLSWLYRDTVIDPTRFDR